MEGLPKPTWLLVRWPSGLAESFPLEAATRRVSLIEGQGESGD